MMHNLFNNIFNNDDLLKLQEKLISQNQTITTAESCTGGLIASYITSNSGSSAIFRGSVITYCNEIKEQELNVQKETMIKYGVVSKEVVTQMLEGVLAKFDADFAVAVSGVAGPNGGTKEKPVGTVVVGAMSGFGTKNPSLDVEICHFEGDRNDVQIQSAKTALRKLQNLLI
jgi:nicotinamide-nucleotide amidase